MNFTSCIKVKVAHTIRMRISFLPKRPLKSEAKTFPMVAAVNYKVYVLKELVFYLNSSVIR